MNLAPNVRFNLALVLCSLVFGGCATVPHPRAYAIRVTLDKPLVGSSVQVDLVGVNATDLPKWQNYSVTQYWQPDNPLRRDAQKYAMQFSINTPNTQVLLDNDPHWAEWLPTGASQLVIIADLPGVITDQAGNADPRRLILPLDRAAWGRDVNTIDILVQESGLRLMTPRKP
jgi:hypothetical protein